MSENKREKVKVTIEFGDNTRVIEADGIAFTTLEAIEKDKHKMGVGVIGNLSVVELESLKQSVEEGLITLIQEDISKYTRHDIKSILKKMLRACEEE